MRQPVWVAEVAAGVAFAMLNGKLADSSRAVLTNSRLFIHSMRFKYAINLIAAQAVNTLAKCQFRCQKSIISLF